jgi:hypothetical protein
MGLISPLVKIDMDIKLLPHLTQVYLSQTIRTGYLRRRDAPSIYSLTSPEVCGKYQAAALQAASRFLFAL